MHVARNIGSRKVQEVMSELIARHGAPGHIRSDNGPEFVAKSLQAWLKYENIKTLISFLNTLSSFVRLSEKKKLILTLLAQKDTYYSLSKLNLRDL